MDGVFAYMSRPSKNGRRKYCYENYNTKEYSFHKVNGVEYMETKIVYDMIRRRKERAEMFAKFKYLKDTWKEI
jgi:predicted mannosyl-3-phosphoglycerate phosphatase (HAD superfamily)